MIKANSPLINASEVLRQMQTKDSVIVDARSGTDSYERFMSGHLENALHVDLDRDLSQKPLDPAIAGRHPLPDIKNFARLLGTIGITPHTSVIVYDDKSGANAAARFWWMLCAFGHKNVQVVDGGLDALKKKNVPLQVRRHKTAAQTVDNAIAESLEECNLPGRPFQLRARPAPAFGEKIRKKCDRAESEDIEADDVLKNGQVRPRSCRRRDQLRIKICQVHVSEYDNRTSHRCQERSAAFEQDARHDDLKEIE